MIVHIVTTVTSLEESIASVRDIQKIIREEGHSTALDWIEPAYKVSNDVPATHLDWPTVPRGTLEAIAKCDVLIVEATQTSFAVGYQVAVATRHKKPVLVLRHKGSSYLRWASFKSGKNKSEILRELIMREIDKNT